MFISLREAADGRIRRSPRSEPADSLSSRPTGGCGFEEIGGPRCDRSERS